MNWTEKVEQYIREGKTVSGSKGDEVLQSSERSSAAFTKTLQDSFAANFGKQSAILDSLNSVFKGIVANPQGFSPQLLSALNTGNSEKVATNFAQARQALNAQEATHGNGLPSGVTAQLDQQLAGQAATADATGAREIAIQNENQRQSNFWNALQGESGVSKELDPLGYGQDVNQSADAAANLGKAYDASKGPGFMGILGGVLGGAVTGAATSGFAPGGAFTKVLSGGK